MPSHKFAVSFYLLMSVLIGACADTTHTAKPPTQTSSLKILLVNDDGLTANITALQTALIAAGYEVVLALPCQNQSGKGAAANFLTPIGDLARDCRGGAATTGAPGIGAIANLQHAFYIDGTPVMATLYGLDIAAVKRWGRAPDLVISGPNEGQNLGSIVINSGTVSNTQFALQRGIPAIAVSADINTTDNTALAAEVADLTVRLVSALQHAGHRELLPQGVALNVNYPKFIAGGSKQLQWRATHFGNFEFAKLYFVEDLGADPTAAAFGLRDVHKPGISLTLNNPHNVAPTTDTDSEALQALNGFITVTPMQQGYETAPAARAAAAQYIGDALQKF